MSYKIIKSFRLGDPCPLSHQPKVLSKADSRTVPAEDCPSEASSARGHSFVRVFAAVRTFRAGEHGQADPERRKNHLLTYDNYP